MKNLINLILALLILSSCSSTKNLISFEEVKQGEQLENAQEISVEQLFQIWMNNAYPTKVDINCRELYKDSDYTYFGENKLTFLKLEPLLYKVNSDSLNIKFSDYKNIDGQLIRNEFWEKAIPTSDKDIWKNSQCTSSSSNPRYFYTLTDSKILIRLDWKVKCDGRKILEKSYNGYYDINKKEIIIE